MLTWIKLNVLSQTIRDIRKILTKKQKRNGIIIALLTLMGAFLDVLGLAAILPILSIALDSSIVHTNKYLNAIYINFGFENENSFLLVIVIALLFVFVIKNTFAYFINYTQAIYTSNIATSLSKRQFLRYFNMSYYFFKEKKSSRIYTNIFAIPSYFTNSVLMPFISLISEFAIVVMIIIGISLMNMKLLLVLALLLFPTFFLLYRATKNKMYQIGQERKEHVPKVVKEISQSIFGYIEVKLFGKEQFFLNNYIELQRRLNKLNAISYILNFLPAKVVEIVAVFGMVIIFIYSLYFSDNRAELLLFIGLFITASYKVMPSMNKILAAIMSIKSGQYTMDILTEAMNEDVDESSFSYNVEPLTFNNTIEFKNIFYQYPGRSQEVIKDLTFKVNKGDIVGIFGTSGSGKSTLMKILLRFYIENKGKLLIDGAPITKENFRNWRAVIGYVKQDPYILDVSLKENIAFGDEINSIDEDKLNKAIHSSALDKVLKELPNGVNTIMGEFGDKFSGGQKQRIEIARALYRDAKVLILDEATSALDMQTEKEIIESIAVLAKEGKTIFVIAHRISTLQMCNMIVELKNGQFAKSYTYPELVAQQMKM